MPGWNGVDMVRRGWGQVGVGPARAAHNPAVIVPKAHINRAAIECQVSGSVDTLLPGTAVQGV